MFKCAVRSFEGATTVALPFHV